MVFGDFSKFYLDDGVLEALQTAARQVRGWPQHYIGVEHVLLAILKNGDGECPARGFLQTLRVDVDEVQRTLEEEAVKGSGPPYAEQVFLTPQCQCVLAMANELRQQRKAGQTDSGHVTEAAALEGRSLAAWAVYHHLGLALEDIDLLPAALRRGLRIAGTAFGVAWELPLTAEIEVDRILDCPAWNARCGPYSKRRRGLWYQMTVGVYRLEDNLRVVLTPGRFRFAAERWFWNWAVRRKSSELAAIPGARRISSVFALKEWPRTITALAGRLQRDFFTSRKPAGNLRLMTEADVAFCRDLYTLFEQRRHVPRGFAESFEEWLKAPDTVRLVIEFEGSLAGCGGFNLRKDPNPEGGDASKLAVGSLSFGLVHPRFQRHGLGNTLLASRLVTIHRMGHPICTLEATNCSVAWLERAGFRFWHTRSTPAGESLFRGSMVITDEDVSILGAWLGSERIAVLASLNPPPVEVTMPAPDQTWQ